MSSYLFILCPPYSGSTVLWKLVSTSPFVSALPTEGQFLPEVKPIMRREPWDPNMKLPWADIKAVWERHWDHSKPVLVEKSPPNLMRTREIVEHFQPIKFLLMVRNPYAHCEGLIRRNGWEPGQTAMFSINALRKQAENAQTLANTLCFTYEALVENPETVARKIEAFAPELGALNPGLSMKVRSIDGIVERGIVDLNSKKISNLSPGDLARINQVLKDHLDVLNYWGYEYYQPSLGHAFAFFNTRGRLLLSRTWQRARNYAGRLTGATASKS